MENSLRGFLDIPRLDPGYRPVEERVRDYRAVERQLSHDDIHKQAARCMDCGTPFCHSYGCPIANVAPEFNSFAFRGQWELALKILLSTNPFPEFTGRVCPAPCEAACVAGLDGDPVAIRQIEQAIAEMGFERGYIIPMPPVDRRTEKVAVIGSGPAGLAAADLLNKHGFRVTVYDSANNAGGILRYGIPDFKLEKWVVERRINLMKEEGIAFEMNITVGRDLSYHYLQTRFDAVCMACGAAQPRDLNVTGRELEGVRFAMDFLTQQNKRIAGEPIEPHEEIVATGKRVIVIGGGDTGSDCVGTAIRQRAESVELWEILPRPPEKRDLSTPWPEWPLKLRKTHAHEEGVRIRWAVMTKEIEGENGQVKGLHAVGVEWSPGAEGGPPIPTEVKGTDFRVKADMVIISMGFIGPSKKGMIEALDPVLDERGNVMADENNMTSKPGVFVAGDMHIGQSLVVRAIGEGRRAARGILSFLSK
jgi:glutamate synthase (NADPH/NADH) small chain